ncbi:helix-turn-helix domain-containing protein [Pseudomonas fluorescens]|uniref:helix-turn-helix domain-containing protein n=1 Tax=Pseudomonas fluorescens TaxID=294 RepID=UPI00191335FD|nr:helix-turn-helix transcriptional regulator [Pseudomonas fluorescens]
MELNAAFGEALKRIRSHQKKTQEDFSVVSSRTYMSTLERGLKSPTIEKMDAISAVLEVHPLTLLAATYLVQEQLEVSALVGRLSDELISLGWRD